MVDKLLVTDVTSSDNDEVVTEVVSSLKCVKVVNREVSKVVSVTFDRLAEHVVTVSVEVGVFNSGVLIVFKVVCMIGGNFLL